VVVWYYDADGRDGAQKKPTSTPPSAHVLWRSRSVQGALVLPERGSGGRQRGLGGHENFADRDLEKMAEFFSCL